MECQGRVVYGWSWEENKKFEVALAAVDESVPDRWEVVAAVVGGEKSAEDVHKHYMVLQKDLQRIESGDLDHSLVFHEESTNSDITNEDQQETKN